MGKISKPADIPDKLYFPIREAAEIIGVEPYVLRFWEKEFPMFRPSKGGTGHRRYRRKDLEIALEIKRLLYDQGYTIAGARSQLQKGASHSRTLPSENRKQRGLPFSDPALRRIQKELGEILTLLDKS